MIINFFNQFYWNIVIIVIKNHCQLIIISGKIRLRDFLVFQSWWGVLGSNWFYCQYYWLVLSQWFFEMRKILLLFFSLENRDCFFLEIANQSQIFYLGIGPLNPIFQSQAPYSIIFTWVDNNNRPTYQFEQLISNWRACFLRNNLIIKIIIIEKLKTK